MPGQKRELATMTMILFLNIRKIYDDNGLKTQFFFLSG